MHPDLLDKNAFKDFLDLLNEFDSGSGEFDDLKKIAKTMAEEIEKETIMITSPHIKKESKKPKDLLYDKIKNLKYEDKHLMIAIIKKIFDKNSLNYDIIEFFQEKLLYLGIEEMAGFCLVDNYSKEDLEKMILGNFINLNFKDLKINDLKIKFLLYSLDEYLL